MELRYRSNYDFSPSRSHHTSTPSPRLDNGTTLIMSRFSATPNSNKQIQGGVHNNTFTNSPNQGRPAALTSNWRQSLDRILRKFVFFILQKSKFVSNPGLQSFVPILSVTLGPSI